MPYSTEQVLRIPWPRNQRGTNVGLPRMLQLSLVLMNAPALPRSPQGYKPEPSDTMPPFTIARGYIRTCSELTWPLSSP